MQLTTLSGSFLHVTVTFASTAALVVTRPRSSFSPVSGTKIVDNPCQLGLGAANSVEIALAPLFICRLSPKIQKSFQMAREVVHHGAGIGCLVLPVTGRR